MFPSELICFGLHEAFDEPSSVDSPSERRAHPPGSDQYMTILNSWTRMMDPTFYRVGPSSFCFYLITSNPNGKPIYIISEGRIEVT